MRSVALLALGACNSIFGNRTVVEGDARFFDAPTDGAVLCPQPGIEPRFSPVLHPVIDQDCGTYAIAADTQRGYGLCAGQISSGPVDERLDAEPGLPVPTAEVSVANPRISPEGDLLLVTTFDLTLTQTTYRSYTPTGTTWTRGPDLPLPQFGNVSVPSRGPDRRVIFYDSNVGKEFRQDAAGGWSEARDVVFGPSPGVHTVWLASDALRFVSWEQALSGGSALYYADRASRDEDFSPPRRLTGVPVTQDLFITEGCTRVYMSSVQAIFYALGE